MQGSGPPPPPPESPHAVQGFRPQPAAQQPPGHQSGDSQSTGPLSRFKPSTAPQSQPKPMEASYSQQQAPVYASQGPSSQNQPQTQPQAWNNPQQGAPHGGYTATVSASAYSNAPQPSSWSQAPASQTHPQQGAANWAGHQPQATPQPPATQRPGAAHGAQSGSQAQQWPSADTQYSQWQEYEFPSDKTNPQQQQLAASPMGYGDATAHQSIVHPQQTAGLQDNAQQMNKPYAGSGAQLNGYTQYDQGQWGGPAYEQPAAQILAVAHAETGSGEYLQGRYMQQAPAQEQTSSNAAMHQGWSQAQPSTQAQACHIVPTISSHQYKDKPLASRFTGDYQMGQYGAEERTAPRSLLPCSAI